MTGKLTDKTKSKDHTFISDALLTDCQTSISAALPYQIHASVARLVMKRLSKVWEESELWQSTGKRAYYFSAEFLVGRAVYNNLLSMKMTEEVGAYLAAAGRSLSELETIEDAALGNGGLGRLAACFLDSAATKRYPLDGYGIRYRFGLFKQSIVNGFQTESLDNWTRYGDPWSVRRDEESLLVRFAGQTVRAVPYDMPIIGYGGGSINTLRLWQSEAVEEFDFEKFNEQKYDQALTSKNRAEDISRVLYPNDSTDKGKALRIRQQYFFCSASIQDILRKHTARYGPRFDNFPSLYAIQLNDTHPTVAICELIRILCDDYGLGFEEAFLISKKTFNYTNHTVMAEALEKWDFNLYRSLLPRICDYIKKIDKRMIREFKNRGQETASHTDNCRILSCGYICMANLAVYGSGMVNGVAGIHTEILKKDVLKDWYAVYPDMFQNKTNGITQRRWLALCNPELSSLITRLLGNDDWVTNLALLKNLEAFQDSDQVLDEFAAIKFRKKQQLSEYVKKTENVDIPASFVYDIQIKRLHEYKRQLLNAFSILDIYFGIKDGRIKDFTPTAFIFGAKAAPGYFRAKGIIKLINEIAKLVNQDESVSDRMRVVFVQNYNVSYAEKLVCAADLSEQISTAGTEASGTGNMKLMLNGAPTLGTFDGANVEIIAEAGLENNYIFGATVEEISSVKDSYDPRRIYESNPRIHRILDALIDGTVSDGGTGSFQELFHSILEGASWHRPDQYYLLLDFEDYMQTKLRAVSEYGSREFTQKAFLNTARAGYFSSDRTIEEYAGDIWKIAHR
jgi:starch phosphorylase